LSVREAIQQLLGRRIGFDVIARQFQPARDSRSKGSIVVYDVNKARQLPLLAVKSKQSKYFCSILRTTKREPPPHPQVRA